MTDSDSTAIVTGGSGFLGSRLFSRLISAGIQVVSIDKIAPRANFFKSSHFRYIQCDLASIQEVNLIPELKVDYFFHLASQTSGARSMSKPELDLKDNLSTTLNSIVLSNKLESKRFIFASSMAVYGDHGNVALSEDLTLQPRSIYGVNKAASEQYIELLASSPWLNLRLFNLYGEGQNLNDLDQGMVSIYAAMAAKHQLVEVRGPLNRVRDFIHVDEAVEHIFHLSTSSNFHNGTYNIGTGRPTSVFQLLDLLRGKFEFEVVETNATKGDVQYSLADVSALRVASPIKDSISIESGIQGFCDWVRNATESH